MVVAISASYYHSIILLSNGETVAVGSNKYGQCNSYNKEIKHSFFKSQSQSQFNFKVTQISAGGFHSVYLFEDGYVWGTGSNYLGQVSIPSKVQSKVVQVAAG